MLTSGFVCICVSNVRVECEPEQLNGGTRCWLCQLIDPLRMSQSDAHKDGAMTASTARPSVLDRRTGRFGLPTPVSSSESFTALMTHQPGQVTVGGPLAMTTAASSRDRAAAEYLLPSPTAACGAAQQPAEARRIYWVLMHATLVLPCLWL